MGEISRRTFLGLSAAGAAALTQLPNLVRSAMASSPRRHVASAIRHVVVLTQENRSFDHYFGTLPGVRGFEDRAALQRPDGSSVFDQLDATSQIVRPFLHTSPTAISDLDHSWQGTHAAWNDGKYDAWVKAKGRASMSHLDRRAIPYHFALADAFTICDHYFCSAMGPTNPNRLFLWSGTCDPLGVAGGPVIDNSARNFRWTTYPERLQSASVDWKIYQNADDNFDDNALGWFAAFKNAQPGTPLYERGMASVPAVAGSTCGDIVAAIESDVKSGTLPFASWIVAPESCSEHPNHSPDNGADFISRVLGALMSNPDSWSETVLLINYDENDGFFDHVPPPTPPAGTENEFIGDMPIGLGPRVPMLVVSPWSRGGNVCSQVFDHTSVIRFIEALTGVVEPNISKWRRRVCGDLMSAFDFATSICMSTACVEPTTESPTPNRRRKRELPYLPNAEIDVEYDSGLVSIALTNAGAESMHFSAYVADSSMVRQYDVSLSDGRVVDAFRIGEKDSRFDIAIHGPNGFLRHFTGNRAGPDVRAIGAFEVTNRGHGRFCLQLKNASKHALTIQVFDNSNPRGAPREVAVNDGSSTSTVFTVTSFESGWYDFTVSVGADATRQWRFAGHVDTSASSTET